MRNFIKWTLVILVVWAMAWMANMSVDKVQRRRTVKEAINIMHDLPLIDMDSLQVDVRTYGRPLIIIYFNSECDHCQYEAKEISQNSKLLSDAILIFVSAEPLQKIKQFAKQYELNHKPNIVFTKIKYEDIITTFGSVGIPHIFIYGPDKKLRKEFKGETKLEAILKYIE